MSDQEASERTYSIFILKIKGESLRSAETFLRNRKWVVGTGTSLREALAYMIQKQPQFMLIAADHPSKKVKILPKLLAQAFPVKVIAYAEGQSGPAIAALHEIGVEYTLFPPVSGPAIERIILKMLRDEERRAKEAAEKKSQGIEAGGENPDEVIRLKGQNLGGANGNSSFEQARAALTQLMSSEDDSPGTFVAKGDRINADSASETGPSGESFAEWDARTRAALAGRGQDSDEGKDPGSAWQEGHGNSDPFSGTESGTSPFIGASPAYGERKKQVPIMESGPIAPKKKITPTYKRDPSMQADRDSIIVKGTQEALDQSVVMRDGLETYQEIEKSSHCACIVVESERFSGYLVAALGKNRKIDESFMNMMKERLFSFLRSHGEIVKDDKSMNLKIQEVEFEDWALEQADFLRKSIHDGDEIAMAFFPTKDTTIRLEESVSEKMLKMSIEELKEDTAVEFDLYIYMPENNKYLLYTPQGKPLYGKQRSRLTEKGVTHMHLRKESAHNVKKYRAQNYLNDKIAAFKQAQKIKKV